MDYTAKFFKLVSWYDNEWGYSNRCVDSVKMMVPPVVAATIAADKKETGLALRRAPVFVWYAHATACCVGVRVSCHCRSAVAVRLSCQRTTDDDNGQQQ